MRMTRRHALPSLSPLYGVETLPGYSLTFLCSGRSFVAFVRARNVQAASHEAMLELAAQCPEFEPDNARLVRAIQSH